MRRFAGFCPAAAGVVLLLPFSTAVAQQSDSLSLLVLDPSGAKVANAAVRVYPAESTDGVPLREARTDAQGRVLLPLPPGSYNLAVEANGFAPLQQVVRVADQAARLDLSVRLAIATKSEVVDVPADDAASDSTVDGQQVSLKGDALRGLSDNPTLLQQELSGLVGTEDGSPPEFRIDGFSGGRLPPLSTIREIRINQNAFSAQFDQRGNSVIDIFTKPGSDKPHGFFLASGNTEAFNAQNPFITAQPPYHSTFLLGNLTGPLGKKTSYFVSGTRNDLENNAAVNAVGLSAAFSPLAIAQAVPNPTVTSDGSVRLDRQLSTNNTFTGRFSFADSAQTNSGVGQLVLASEGINTDTKTSTLQLGNTTIAGPKTVIETRFQYLRTRTTQTPVSTAPTLVVQGSFNGGGSPTQNSHDSQDNYEFQEYMSFDRGKHFIRAGARYRLIRDSNFSTANYNGQYIFPTLTAYQITLQGQANGQSAAQIRAAGGGASQFNLTAGTPSAVILTGNLGAYLEDEWKATKNFSLIYGLRYETQSAIPDHNDPAPRLGFSYAVQRGKAKLVTLRGGVGVFYDRFQPGLILNATRQNGITQQAYYVQNPDTFPAIPAPASLTSLPPTIYQIAPNLHSAYEVTDSIAAERGIGKLGNVTVTFQTSRGIHQFLSRSVLNPATTVATGGGSSTAQHIYQYSSDGIANTRTVFVNYNLRFGKHAGIWGNYNARWRQADSGGASTFVSNPNNVGADYGRTQSLARQRIYTGGWADIYRGFELSYFIGAHTNTRFNITTGQDNNGDTIYNDRPAFATDLTRPSVVRTALGNFDTAPIAGQTIIPINYGVAPGFASLNVESGKNFSFGKAAAPAPPPPDAPKGAAAEKPPKPYNLGFFVEAQNLFNNVNAATPVGVLTSPFFGRSITLNNEQSASTAANRQINLYAVFRF